MKLVAWNSGPSLPACRSTLASASRLQESRWQQHMTIYSAHLWLPVHNVIQTELLGIKVLFLLLLINATIPIDFVKQNQALNDPPMTFLRIFPTFDMMHMPYGHPSSRLPKQLPEAVKLTVAMTIQLTPTEMVFMTGKMRPVSLAHRWWLLGLCAGWCCPSTGYCCTAKEHGKRWAMLTWAADLPYSASTQLSKHQSRQTSVNLTYGLTTV